MMGWYGGGMTGFAWMGMGLFWLALLGLIVWLAIRLWPGKSQEPEVLAAAVVSPKGARVASVAMPALAILDERLASGEVDVETYRTIRAELVEGHKDKR